MKHRKNVSSRQKRKLLIIFVGIIGVMFFLQGFVAIFLLLFLPDNSTTTITNQSTAHHVASPPFQFHHQWQQHQLRQRSPILQLEYVWEQYQQSHSQDSLQANRYNRTYQVIYYSCPYAAGNLFHDTFNQMIVAIALNRTMLWKYNDEITCNATRKGYGGLICLKANTEQDCEQSLIRSSWLPRYDDWKGILFPKNQKLPIRKPENYIDSDWWGTTNRRLLVSSAPFVYQTTAKQLLGSHNAYYLKQQNYSQIILEKLFSSGPDVLFGMLFRETFTFASQIIPPEYNPRQYIGHKTYAIHSRHFNTKSDGSNIKKERECLISMLDDDFPTTTTTTKPCTIFLLSDRTLTIDLLTSYIKGRWEHCTPVVATHVVAGMGSSRNNDGHYLEHGVYAGTGFFQDLMVASQARDGFIGHCYRTSSQLLKEFIEYDRTMEALDDTGNPPSHDLPVCCLPSAIAQ